MSTKVFFVTFDSVKSEIAEVLAQGTTQNMALPSRGHIIRFYPNPKGYEVRSVMHVVHGTRTSEIYVYLDEPTVH